MPATIIVDFELAVHNVVRTLFPASSLKGCLFHVGPQALWRKLQELGLSANGKEDNGTSKWIRLFDYECGSNEHWNRIRPITTSYDGLSTDHEHIHT